MSRKTGVVLSYTLLLVQIASSLLFMPFLIRSLGQAEYGLYSLTASITGYFMLLDAGVGNALVRYVAKFRVLNDDTAQRRFLGFALAFYGGVGVVVILLGFVLRANLSAVFGNGLTADEIALANRLLSITLVSAALTMIFSAFDRVIIAYERFAVSKGLAIVAVTMRVIVLSALLQFGYRAMAVVTVSLVLTVLFGLISAAYVLFHLKLRPVFRGLEFSFISEVASYSGFILIQMIAAQLNFLSNQVLLGVLSSSVSIAVFAVGAQLTTYFQLVAGGVNGVLMPGVVRMVETGATPAALLNEMVKVGRVVFILLGIIFVTFAISGESFVDLWVGSGYSGAYWAALLMMAPLTLSLAQAVGTHILWAMDKHRIQAMLQIGVALVNIVLTVVLIRLWSPVLGAAAATAFACALGDVVVLNAIFSRQIGVSIRNYYSRLFKGILPSLALAAAVGVVAGLVAGPGWMGFALRVASILIAYSLALRLFGLNCFEKALFSSLIPKVRARV